MRLFAPQFQKHHVAGVDDPPRGDKHDPTYIRALAVFTDSNRVIRALYAAHQ